jgi:hypothetical protein
VEAFYKRVPVLAYAATAVPATMDGGGVLYDTKDPLEIARLMDAVLDPRIEEAVLQSQDAALDRLRARDFDGTLRRFVEDTLTMPPREAPGVAWDFWHQFDQFDRFEELRQFRPALYKALPLEPRLAPGDWQLAKEPQAQTTSQSQPPAANRQPPEERERAKRDSRQ